MTAQITSAKQTINFSYENSEIQVRINIISETCIEVDATEWYKEFGARELMPYNFGYIPSEKELRELYPPYKEPMAEEWYITTTHGTTWFGKVSEMRDDYKYCDLFIGSEEQVLAERHKRYEEEQESWRGLP